MEIVKYKVHSNLPDPFRLNDGTRVKDIAGWETRRKELYKTAVELQYGGFPPEPEFLEIDHLYNYQKIQCFRLTTGRRDHPVSFIMYIHTPDGFKLGESQCPVVVCGDLVYMYTRYLDSIKLYTDMGVAFVAFNRLEVANDPPSKTPRSEGRRGPLFDCYPDGEFGCIAAWAWSYLRCVDALEALDIVGDNLIAFTGHSRGAKTALLAGIMDPRADIINPVQTCAGGASCYRVYMEANGSDGIWRRSETLADCWNNYSFWYGAGMEEYKDDVAHLPFDSHELLAMVAPRTLLISNADDDTWANPLGSYQTAVAAREVWKLYGNPNGIRWYWREGNHSYTHYDFEMLANTIAHERDGAPLDERLGRIPFDAPAPIYDWKCPTE